MLKIQKFYILIIILFSCLAFSKTFAGPFETEEPKFLPVDSAFKIINVFNSDAKTINIKFLIAEDYYLYKSKFKIKTSPEINSTINSPEGLIKEDEYFGKQEVFYNDVTLEVNFDRNPKDTKIQVIFQGCSEKGLCYPPTSRSIYYDFKPPQQKISETQLLANTLNSDKFFWGLLTFFISGVLLSFTPCVLPMVPVLSGIIIGSNSKKAKILTLSYIAGVITLYTLLGIFAGLTGNLLSSSLQNTFFIGLSSALFFLFALAMFDFYHLSLPHSITEKINNLIRKFQSKNSSTTFILGLLSALILSPCVAPPLAASILYISQTQNYIFGGLGLFSLSLGMSLPLFIVGFSMGHFLPKPGAWMDYIKKIMGFTLIAMAIYIARPLMTELQFFLLLILNLLILCFFSFYKKTLLEKLNKKVLITIYGIFIIVFVFLSTSIYQQYSTQNDYDRDTFFNQIQTLEELEKNIDKEKNKPILIDFYADWCVACLEYEKYTFQDENVQLKMKDFVLIQIDVTKNNKEHEKLLKRFGLYGPPGIIFFDKNGNHLQQYDIVGFKNAEDFLSILNKIKLYD